MKFCKTNISNILIIIFFGIFFAGCSLNNQTNSKYDYTHKLIIGNKTLYIEIADNDEKRKQGLSKREGLNENQGMLFIFDSDERYSFWMKDMNFSLDLIWIKDFEIVEITSNVPHPTNPIDNLEIFKPKEKVNAVLEVNANWTKKNKIKIGDKIRFK